MTEETGTGSIEERILGGLDEEQRQVATTLQGPLCVLAGAGTGKTRAITHRIAYGVHTGVYKPSSLLAVTFTARAAAEMRSRLRDLGAGAVQTRTFHAAALRQLQYFWPQAIGGQLPNIVDYKAPLITEAARRLRTTADRATVRDLASEIEWAKVSMLTPESYVAAAADRGQPGGLDPITVSRIFQSYEDVKTDRQLIDFEDVLLLTVAILEDDPRVAASVREQYRHFVVDEYQDVSPLQQRLLDLWLGGRDELCVVGDASQTIYSFTGATPRHLLDFTDRYEHAPVVKLVRDYRSTPQVVHLANRVLAARQPEAGVPDRDIHWPTPLELVAQRENGPDPSFLEAKDDEAEAAEIAARIKKLISEGTPASEIAILYRTNGQSAAYEQALASAGVGYLLRGGERFFARREVRDAMLQLRSAARNTTTEPGVESVPQLTRDILVSLGYSATAPAASGAVREKWESLSALVALADEMAVSRAGSEIPFTLNLFVAELEERAASQHAPTLQGVTLASLHAAKGLEWDAVFLVGLSEGLMPISFADDQAGYDEERRLLYVGITRARKYLGLSWSLARTPGGRANRRPSRFLDGLRPSGSSRTATPARSTKRRAAATPPLCRVCGTLLSSASERKLGRCGGCPAGYDEAVFESLRAWRLQVSQANSLPAFVIFTDATLMAIAENNPSNVSALGQISGVGKSKLERYGEAVLAILAGDSAE
ncbi:ATP-dependent DNA helicase UvrD2 [Paeniglutamicibacter sp. Y32M11]|uniref:ATP-dependent DNA helicase UvrD2 n=1 Tax=Paeniglutamicibacter sp. Y32M11 TaxID=2853258 RepID=UPI001C52A737|nr:ATP-dependent DNA helicase UvrD2 [Paeniglutamicibacter sp. Y32M11]QXQ09140.1 ATP-dependent DNA helicase UvrD2 [Paeniglutamicibacter sp. Y32M11]